MKWLETLFHNNRAWADSKSEHNPSFFETLSETQRPNYLWIGCADSRVPANEIVGLDAGELFVHRNVSNMVQHTDTNCWSVIQYAVEALHIEHIIVCGHYQCGGIISAMGNSSFGLIDHWLMNIREIYAQNRDELESIMNRRDRIDRLCELNVKTQIRNLAHSAIVQKAWSRGQNLALHGWMYNLKNGLLTDLGASCNQLAGVDLIYKYEV
ncbi:MAG: carbonate dehydratase [Acidobacteria bacterium]|nr:carbonate dehydratase [Acidobacteriota bacterium]MCB9397292.1 carbonate dehydratase [Acidobacteriota bacterium]